MNLYYKRKNYVKIRTYICNLYNVYILAIIDSQSTQFQTLSFQKNYKKN